ncbi:MAG: hypothetical protein AAGI54_03880 [Planctomycetota bacterium]
MSCERSGRLAGLIGPAVFLSCVLSAPLHAQFLSDRARSQAFVATEDRNAAEATAERWVRALGRGDRATLAALFDTYRVAGPLRSFARKHGDSEASILDAVGQQRDKLIGELVQMASTVENLRLISMNRVSPNEYEIVVLPEDGYGGTIDVIRYWLERRPQGWRVVDVTNTILLTRLSDYNAMSLRTMRVLGGRPVPNRLVSLVQEEIARVEDRTSTEEMTRVAMLASLVATETDPQALVSLRMMLGLSQGTLGRFQEALAQFDAVMEATEGDLSGPRGTGHFMRGSMLMALDRKPEAEAAMRRAIEMDGRVPDYLSLLSEIRERRGDTLEAESLAIEAALGHPDGDERVYTLFERVEGLTDETIDALVAGYSDLASAYARQAEGLWQMERWEPLSRLTEAVAKRSPASSTVALSRSRLALSSGDEAAAVEQAALAVDRASSASERAQQEAWQRHVQQTILGPAEVYGRVDDPAAYFRETSYSLFVNERRDRLEALIRVRAADLGDAGSSDIDLLASLGDLGMLREDYRSAEVAYRRALDQADQSSREAYRHAAVSAMLRAGRWLEAYEHIKPVDATFSQAATFFESEEDEPSLSALIERREVDDPYDPTLAWHRAGLARLRGDHAAERAALRVARGDGINDQQRPFLERRLILTALAMEDLDGARREAERSKRRDGDPYFDMLIAAHTGDVRLMLDTVTACVEQFGYDPMGLYLDDALGEALRSETFAVVRDVYPPPVEEPQDSSGSPSGG